MVKIGCSRAMLDRLLAEAASMPTTEICGLLFGTSDRIDAAQPATNVAEDPSRTFEIDPVALIAAHRAQRAGGPRLIGCYHSHPSGAREPSARDREAAEPGALWLILASGEARLWRAAPDGFVPLTIVGDGEEGCTRPPQSSQAALSCAGTGLDG